MQSGSEVAEFRHLEPGERQFKLGADNLAVAQLRWMQPYLISDSRVRNVL